MCSLSKNECFFVFLKKNIIKLEVIILIISVLCDDCFNHRRVISANYR